MTEFIHKVCFQSEMEYECVLAAVVFMERLLVMSEGQLELTPLNWKGVVLSCMILASKVFDDFAMFNADYCCIFPGLLVSRVNELEVALLEALQHRLWVSQRQYAEMHFRMQDMIARGVIQQVRLTTSVVTETCAPINSGKTERSSTLMSAHNSRIADMVKRHQAQVAAGGGGGDEEFELNTEGGGGGRSRESSNATEMPRSRATSEDVPRGRVYSTGSSSLVIVSNPSRANTPTPITAGEKPRSRTASSDMPVGRGRVYSTARGTVVVIGRGPICAPPLLDTGTGPDSSAPPSTMKEPSPLGQLGGEERGHCAPVLSDGEGTDMDQDPSAEDMNLSPPFCPIGLTAQRLSGRTQRLTQTPVVAVVEGEGGCLPLWMFWRWGVRISPSCESFGNI